MVHPVACCALTIVPLSARPIAPVAVMEPATILALAVARQTVPMHARRYVRLLAGQVLDSTLSCNPQRAGEGKPSPAFP